MWRLGDLDPRGPDLDRKKAMEDVTVPQDDT
jgi:hypothetical protein